MKLKYTFETMELDDRIVAVPVGEHIDEFHGVIKLNEVASFIFNLLKYDIDEADILKAMEEEYEVSREVLIKDIHIYLDEFREKGLLVE